MQQAGRRMEGGRGPRPTGIYLESEPFLQDTADRLVPPFYHLPVTRLYAAKSEWMARISRGVRALSRLLLLRLYCSLLHGYCTNIAQTWTGWWLHLFTPEGPRLILESRRVAITITEWPTPPLETLQSFVLAAVTILQIPRTFCLHTGHKPSKNVARW